MHQAQENGKCWEIFDTICIFYFFFSYEMPHLSWLLQVHWVATNFTCQESSELSCIGPTYNFADVYTGGTPLNEAYKQAYADVIVGHYAERFGSRLAGYWFDQGE